MVGGWWMVVVGQHNTSQKNNPWIYLWPIGNLLFGGHVGLGVVGLGVFTGGEMPGGDDDVVYVVYTSGGDDGITSGGDVAESGGDGNVVLCVREREREK